MDILLDPDEIPAVGRCHCNAIRKVLTGLVIVCVIVSTITSPGIELKFLLHGYHRNRKNVRFAKVFALWKLTSTIKLLSLGINTVRFTRNVYLIVCQY